MIPRTTEQWKDWQRCKVSSQSDLQTPERRSTINTVSTTDTTATEIEQLRALAGEHGVTLRQFDYLRNLASRAHVQDPDFDLAAFTAETVVLGKVGVSKIIDELRKDVEQVIAKYNTPTAPAPSAPVSAKVDVEDHNFVVSVFITNADERLLVRQFNYTGRGRYRQAAALIDAKNFAAQLRRVLGLS